MLANAGILGLLGVMQAGDTRKMSAVVTGSNKGIGIEICRQLLRAGVSVVVTARNVQRGEQAASLLRGGPNGHLVVGFVQMDVADDESVTRGARQISSLLGGKLDILINNAGVAYPDSTFGAEEARNTVNINTFGTMRATRALLQLLSGPHAGRIVNVASVESSLRMLAEPLQKRFSDMTLSDQKIITLMNEFVTAVAAGNQKRMGWVHCTMYGASKVAQMAFGAMLARELTNARSNVTVASCCPGFCKTEMSDQCYGPGSGHKSAAEGADTPVWLALMSWDDARRSHGQFFTDRKLLRWG